MYSRITAVKNKSARDVQLTSLSFSLSLSLSLSLRLYFLALAATSFFLIYLYSRSIFRGDDIRVSRENKSTLLSGEINKFIRVQFLHKYVLNSN